VKSKLFLEHCTVSSA